MEKVLSEKNKQIRAQQKLSRGLAKKRRVVYPSSFVRNSKTGTRIPYRRPKPEDAPAAQPVQVGTIGHDRAPLDATVNATENDAVAQKDC